MKRQDGHVRSCYKKRRLDYVLSGRSAPDQQSINGKPPVVSLLVVVGGAEAKACNYPNGVLCERWEREELDLAKSFGERFDWHPHLDLATARASIATVAALHLEARFVLTMQEPTLTGAIRKKKLENLVSKVGELSKEFGADMKTRVFRKLITSSMSALVSGR
eukprot:3529315-Amphidinium_carterae.2